MTEETTIEVSNNSNKKRLGLKMMTKPHSKQVRLAPGGKHFVADTGKPNRKYCLKGE